MLPRITWPILTAVAKGIRETRGLGVDEMAYVGQAGRLFSPADGGGARI